MSFETALRDRIKAVAGGASVEWDRRAPGSYPAIVLMIVTHSQGRHMTGLDGWMQPRVQIDVLAKSNPEKAALRDAIVATLAPSVAVGAVRFGRSQQVRWSTASEDTDTGFVFRDMIEAVLPHQLET